MGDNKEVRPYVAIIFAYGTLRKDLYNFKRFNQFGNLIYIKTIDIEGWDLYDLGPYPFIKKGKNKLKVDIIKIDDKNVFDYIHAVELSAGYKAEKITVDGVEGNIYYFDDVTFDKFAKISLQFKDLHLKKINNGDYKDFLSNGSKQTSEPRHIKKK